MGRRYVLVDDLDGSELPDDTAPITLSLGRTTYNLYLSEDNYGKLMEALNPFIVNAETANEGIIGSIKRQTATTRRSSTGSDDKEKMKAVRAWAQSTGFKFKDAQGNEKTLGDRGRIPDEVVKAYEEANA